MMSPKCGARETRPREGLSPTSPQAEAGMRIEPPPSLAWAAATRPAATAAAEPPLEPPGERVGSQGFLRGPEGQRLGGGEDAQLGRVGLAQEDEARLAEALDELGVVVLDPADLAQEAHALVHRVARRVGGQVLEQEGHSAEGAVGQVAGRGGARLVEQRRYHRVDLGVEALDAGDRLVDQLGRARLPASDQLRLIRGVRDRTGHAAKLTQIESPQGLAHPALAGVEVPAVALGQAGESAVAGERRERRRGLVGVYALAQRPHLV